MMYPGYTHRNSQDVLFYLNSKKVTLRNGREQVIFYFSKKSTVYACDLPATFEVVENPRNHFVVLKRI